jgi:hypothetical protein
LAKPYEIGDNSWNSWLAVVEFVSSRPDHGNEMAQLILNVARRGNRVSNFLSH